MDNILIIKHGALGDIILATAAFAAIRAHYPQAHITLLTTKPFAELMAASPYFNEVWVDAKPKFWQLAKLRGLLNQLSSTRFNAVFDLQNSLRTASYWWVIARRTIHYSGTALMASPRYRYNTRIHAYENIVQQLALSHIKLSSRPDLGWLQADISALGVHGNYALLVAGGAPHRPQKRWPHFAQLAAEIANTGTTPVLIGGTAEAEILNAIASNVPQTINLCNRTSIAQIATLARSAAFAVGNDTGPMHIIAASGCPSLVLFSSDSNPQRAAPVGAKTLQRHQLTELEIQTVREAAATLDSEAAKALA